MSPAPALWEEQFSARSYEIDPGRRARVKALCNWLQDAAGNHAQALGWGMEGLIARGLTWVLSRFHLLLHRYPNWREPVQVQTWPSGVQRLWALRDFLVCGEAGEVLAVATSAWLRLKVASKRPVRPDREFSELASQTPPQVLADSFQRLPGLIATDTERRFRVRHTDLDINQHANNVSLISWLVESAPDEMLLGGMLREIEVEFHAESQFGEEIVARSQHPREGESHFTHVLLRGGTGDEIARARTVWDRLPP